MIGTVSIGINSVGVDDEDDDVAGSYTLTAEAGSFTLSGQAAGLVAARKLSADAGAFVLSGQTVALRADRLLTASQGAFTLTGQDADLIAPSYTLTADAGSFTLTGKDATLTASAQPAQGGGAGWYGPPNWLKYERRLNRRRARKEDRQPPVPKTVPPHRVEAVIEEARERGLVLSRIEATLLLIENRAEMLRNDEDAIALLLLAA